MQFDSFIGRFVCSVCGHSEKADADAGAQATVTDAFQTSADTSASTTAASVADAFQTTTDTSAFGAATTAPDAFTTSSDTSAFGAMEGSDILPSVSTVLDAPPPTDGFPSVTTPWADPIALEEALNQAKARKAEAEPKMYTPTLTKPAVGDFRSHLTMPVPMETLQEENAPVQPEPAPAEPQAPAAKEAEPAKSRKTAKKTPAASSNKTGFPSSTRTFGAAGTAGAPAKGGTAAGNDASDPAASAFLKEKVDAPLQGLDSDDPHEILRIYFRSFYCSNVGDALLKSGRVRTANYIDSLDAHPALVRLNQLLPGNKIVPAIHDYCKLERECMKLEKELEGKQRHLSFLKRDAERKKKEQREAEERLSEANPKSESGTGGFLFWAVIGSLFLARLTQTGAIFILGVIVSVIYTLIHSATKSGQSYERQAPTVVNATPEREVDERIAKAEQAWTACQSQVYALNTEKGRLIREIRAEEALIRDKYWDQLRKERAKNPNPNP